MKACWILALMPTTLLGQSIDEEALIRSVFADLNPTSIEQNVEFCGYIGFTADGELAYSQPTRGDEGSCLSDDPTNLELITASYYTHGGFSPTTAANCQVVRTWKVTKTKALMAGSRRRAGAFGTSTQRIW